MITFKETGIRPELVKAVKELGFEQPMPVQEQVIPVILNSTRDIIALAQTGTGKTAAFGLPLLSLIDERNRNTQVLVLCPTRAAATVQLTRLIGLKMASTGSSPIGSRPLRSFEGEYPRPRSTVISISSFVLLLSTVNR